MIPKPLSDHRRYSDAQSLLVALRYLKKHDLAVEWKGDIFIIRELLDAPNERYTEQGRMLGFSIESYNGTVVALRGTSDKTLLDTVYAMINSISPVGLLRKRLFGEEERVGKVNAESKHEDLSDCRIHIDLLGNLYNAAKENPLSDVNTETRRNAAKAHAALNAMEKMYEKAVKGSRSEEAWEKNIRDEGRYRNIQIVEIALRDESLEERMRRRNN